MSTDRRTWIAAAAPGAVLALVLGGLAALLAATLEPAERAVVWAAIEPRAALVVMGWFFAALALGALARRLWLVHGAAPAQLAERLQALRVAGDGAALPDEGPDAGGSSAGTQALMRAVRELMQERRALQGEIERRVAEGSRAVEREKNRLAALMAELAQAVVVCNLDGRILLFNDRARTLLEAPGGASSTPAPIGGGSRIALGRSIHALIEPRAIAHALEVVHGARDSAAAAHTAFVITIDGGPLLRVLLAPVRGGEGALDGYVLLLEDVSQRVEAAGASERLVQQLTEGTRGAIGNVQAAIELLDDPGLDAPTRERFLGVIRDETAALARRVNAAAAEAGRLAPRWPLEPMQAADFALAAAQRIEARCASRVAVEPVDPALWLRVDSFGLVEALVHLASRLEEGFDAQRLRLRVATLAPSDGAAGAALQAGIDLIFPSLPLSSETVAAWETEPIAGVAGGITGGVTLREIASRHGGAFWFERDRARQRGVLRLLVPLADGAAAPAPAGAAAPAPADASEPARERAIESRPEFYDFDLFARFEHGGAAATGGELASVPLADLAFTVFDTETTGLEPSNGDRIIQIGAVRIVGGKLRRADSFEQLIDPERSLPEAGIAIHGITPDMLVGQPTLARVLPAFHAFAADSVLVAHNAAFDLRFLELAEASTGVRFTMPVLDTLLLSSVLHPNQASHGLEAIAARLGVSVIGRHTALGDAMVTAEVFLRLVPLLREAGITTLGEALEASRRSALSRLAY